MKMLFVCHGNVGRSQMAEALYNHFTNSNDASSAGTDKATPLKYPSIPEYIRNVMLEEGIDISQKKVKTLTEDMVKDANKIYIMCEKEQCPDYLLNSKNIYFWKIEDPYKMGIEGARKVRDIIKSKVKEII